MTEADAIVMAGNTIAAALKSSAMGITLALICLAYVGRR